MPVNGEIFPRKAITVHIHIKAGLGLLALAFSSSMAPVQSCSSKGFVFGHGLHGLAREQTEPTWL